MEQLIKDGYRGKFDLIYFDGPFNSGRIFAMPNEKLGVNLINPWDELRGVRHYLNSELFLQDYLKRIRLAKELLSETGFLVLQIYQKEGHYLKVLLDQEFGRANFLAEIIWKMHDIPRPYHSQFGLSHECLFVYSRTSSYLKKDELFLPSVWDDIGIYETLGDENTFYPSQKPEKLMERIIEMTTEENALVGDFYCGSGSFEIVAERLNRRWMASDSSQYAMKVTQERLAKLGVTVEVYTLVDHYDERLVHGHIYNKQSDVPFSLFELNELSEAMRDQVTVVNAPQFSGDVDLFSKYPVTFNIRMPLINANGISENEVKLVPRPKPVAESDGIHLDITDPLEWILYNIQHVEHDQNEYLFNWTALQEKVKQINQSLKNNWIADIQYDPDYTVIKDVFGTYYHIK
jgi:adenine specific DNA methylase Mod